MKPALILIAEDDLETANLVGESLVAQGHRVDCHVDGESALKAAIELRPDLLILDRMLPGLDGLSLLQKLRSMDITTPALMLTALGRIEDRVTGLNAGADDYLVKPFAISELAARVNALLRRSEQTPDTLLEINGLVVDIVERTVHRGGQLIHLQPREFRLLDRKSVV